MIEMKCDHCSGNDSSSEWKKKKYNIYKTLKWMNANYNPHLTLY